MKSDKNPLKYVAVITAVALAVLCTVQLRRQRREELILESRKKILKYVLVITALVVAALCAAQFILHMDRLNESPFDRSYVWNSPSYTVARNGEVLVVDSNKRVVSVTDGNGVIWGRIIGKSGADSFSNTNYISADDDYIYIADIVYASSGTRVTEESVKKFDRAGNFIDTLFYREYEDGKETMPAQNGYIRWMGWYEESVYFIYFDNVTLSVNKITEDGYSTVRELPGEAVPDIWNIAYSACDDTVWIASKTGEIFFNRGNERFSLYSTEFAGGAAVFVDIAAYGENVYAVEVISHRVFNIITEEVLVSFDDPLEAPFINRISAYGGGVATTDSESVILATDGEGVIYYEAGAMFADGIYRNTVLTWLSMVLLIAIVAAFLVMIVVYTIKNAHSKFTGLAFVVVFAVITSTTLIASTVMNELFARINDSTNDSLIRTVSVISASSSTSGLGDAAKQIDSADDYNSEAHQFIQDYLDTFCDAAYDTGSNMYFTLLKFDGNFFYGVCDYEKTIGVVWPYIWYADSGYDYVVETGETVVVTNEADEFGVWSYAVAPVMDSEGEIVAVVEFGVNMITEQQQNSEAILSMVVRIAVIILLIVLLLIEGTSLVEGISGFRHEKDPNIPYFLRPMIFLTFFASNLSAAFIPQMSQEIFDSSNLAFGGSLASALPMSLQLFAIAVAALPSGRLIEKFSLRPLMTAACVVQVAGYAVIATGAYSQQYILFSAGHVVSGLGIGVTVVALNTMPDRIRDENLRTTYYSNLNAGIISGVVIGLSIGSYIAEAAGHAFTFIASGIVVLFIMVLVIISVDQGKAAHVALTDEALTKEETFGTGKFLGNVQVLSFVLCVMMPLLILMYFKDYLFPLYGSENGMTDVSIGNIMLFGGAVSIVFGTVIADWLFKKCGSFGMITVSSLTTSACLVLFGLIPSVESAITVVFILSLTTGFGLAGQEVYYSSLPAFRKFGARRAMSLYSVFDNVSQTAAPLLMGALLVFGYGEECLLLGGASIGLYLIFSLIRIVSNRFGGKNNAAVFTGSRE